MGSRKDRIISSFARVVRKNISPCTIILFGSRAKKKAKKTSDYDFLIISPKFKNVDREKRAARIYFLKRKIPAPRDIICLTPKEFEERKAKIGVIKEAIQEGIEI
ncbi:nucleotidyltransferase domain-containing protein [Candidatus Woesearchaeota archaeon]|nr:nucleotidyltransferase domain-containing protein [Candidatus Woesearchaeota archaeon]